MVVSTQSCGLHWSHVLSAPFRTQDKTKLRQARATAHSALNDFWGSGDQLHRLLFELADRGLQYETCIDVGAGMYGKLGPGDAALGLQFHEIFSAKATRATRVFLFEPDPNNPVHAKATGRGVLASTMAVGAEPGMLQLFGSKNSATTNPRLLGLRQYRPSKGPPRYLNATTVDTLVQEHHLESIDVLKTDTEGCEWEVLHGARQTLLARKVRVLLVAYEDKWSATTLSAAWPVSNMSIAADVGSMQLPTLRSVTRELDAWGYDSYLLGRASASTRHGGTRRGVQFIPLSGSLWDDAFEIGRDPHGLSFPWTWFDFVSVRSGSEESAIIEEIVKRSVCSETQPLPTGATRPFLR